MEKKAPLLPEINEPRVPFIKPKLNAREAVMGLMSWLTVRKEISIFSRSHDASLAVELIKKFEEFNPLGECRDNWTDYLTPVEEIPDEPSEYQPTFIPFRALGSLEEFENEYFDKLSTAILNGEFCNIREHRGEVLSLLSSIWQYAQAEFARGLKAGQSNPVH